MIGIARHRQKGKRNESICGIVAPQLMTDSSWLVDCGRCREILRKRSALESAVEKGRKAARDGLSESDCPYQDKRKSDGRLTFSRAFVNAWRDGFMEVSGGSSQA